MFVCLALACAGACSDTTVAPAPTPASPTPAPPAAAPAISISAPTPIGPASGTAVFGWPTFTWSNATKTNTNHALLYRFDLSLREDFASVSHTMMIAEGADQTSYTPPGTLAPPAEGNLYWRVIAIDQANAVQSQPSEVQRFAFYENTQQNRVAMQLYGSLWTNARPSGSRGRARLGPGWDAAIKRSFNGVTFQSPPLDVLRIYDLLDLGMTPDAAIGWLRSNGYGTDAVWYPSVWSIGFPYQYMTLLPQNFSSGSWELVHRAGA